MKKIIAISIVCILFLCGCDVTISDTPPQQKPSGNESVNVPEQNHGSGENGGITGSTASESDVSADTEVSFYQEYSDLFTDRDNSTEYTENESFNIVFEGNKIISSNSGVKVNGTTATIVKEGTYVFSGTLDDGMIIVDIKDTEKLQIVFEGVKIHSSDSAPIYVKSADKVFITLSENTENLLSNGGKFDFTDDNGIDAVVFSKEDLSFNGNGKLVIDSPAGHGIVCKDDLVIIDGEYDISSSSHGIDANNSVRVSQSNIKIVSGKDGIRAEHNEDTSLGFVYFSGGSYEIKSVGDGIYASSHLQISGGEFNITTGGGSASASRPSQGDMGGGMRPGGPRPGGRASASTSTADTVSTKGIKAQSGILIQSGSFVFDTEDDSVHSNDIITIENGNFEISAGDDAFHADTKLSILNGNINIADSYEGLEALEIVVSGGNIKIVASDDGINAAGGNDDSGFGGMRPGGDMFGGGSSKGSILISGGEIYMNASGDGIDANGTLEITGGKITVCGPTQGDTSVLDYDVSAKITGGVFIGTGSRMMSQTFSASAQGVLSFTVGNQSANTKITITNDKGETILHYEPALEFQYVVISMPELVKGESYTVTVGNSQSKLTA